MPSHKLQSATLTELTPEKMVSFTSNELIELWKDKHGFDLWDAIGQVAVEVRDHKKMKAIDKGEFFIKLGELGFKLKRAGSQEKGGAVQVNVMTVDPRRS